LLLVGRKLRGRELLQLLLLRKFSSWSYSFCARSATFRASCDKAIEGVLKVRNRLVSAAFAKTPMRFRHTKR
jgi:hypothetical protein